MLTRYYIPMNQTDLIRLLINRLARLDGAETWEGGLNPAQIAALDYLARANRFSRAPSHVADYLGTTRGTMSQTLKSLVRKGYAREARSARDKRSVLFELTAAGQRLAGRHGQMRAALAALPVAEQTALFSSLSALLSALLAANGGRAFGICRECIHHRQTADGAHCALLSLPLSEEDAGLICHEQVAA
ncbi:MAG: MarR family transcriptional regulator [Paracoccaceae bacterium]